MLQVEDHSREDEGGFFAGKAEDGLGPLSILLPHDLMWLSL